MKYKMSKYKMWNDKCKKVKRQMKNVKCKIWNVKCKKWRHSQLRRHSQWKKLNGSKPEEKPIIDCISFLIDSMSDSMSFVKK